MITILGSVWLPILLYCYFNHFVIKNVRVQENDESSNIELLETNSLSQEYVAEYFSELFNPETLYFSDF